MKKLVRNIKNRRRHLIPRHNRLSMFCKVMNDESHFLLHCKKLMEDCVHTFKRTQMSNHPVKKIVA